MNHRSAKPTTSMSRSHADVEDSFVDEREQIGEEVRKTVAALMPWGVSILAHVGLVLLAFLLVWQTLVPGEEPPQAPKLMNPPEASAPSSHSPSDEPEMPDTAQITPVVLPVKPLVPGLTHAAARPQVVTPVVVRNPLLVTNPNAIPKGGPKFFDIPGFLGDRPDGEPRPTGQAAKTFVYLIDASGSMVDVLPFVINELNRTLPQHQPDHRVSVMIFSGEGVFELPGTQGMREMTSKHVQRLRQWLALDSHGFKAGGPGSVNVRQALTRGLGYRPDVVFLLSDNLTGGGQGATQHEVFQDDLLDLIKDHNRSSSPATIHTIQFLYEDPLVRLGMTGTLKRIADENSGQYNFISQQDLNLR